jgi:uncharacterized protein (TIGR03118 family)
LASDVPGLALVTDPNLVNPWGIAFSPTGPFWFADNGSGVSDLLDGSGLPVPLVVAVPSAVSSGSTPTGTVFNGGAGFVVSENGDSAPSRFLFAGEDGTISGWTSVIDPARAILAIDNSSSGAVYTGLALAADSTGQSFLYAADFGRDTIDVFDQNFRPILIPGSFQDSNLPDGYAPFNIQNINNLLVVTYAQRDENGREDDPGAGHGFIDVYNTDGSLIMRFASQGALDSPWGLALAPADFGAFGGALLVGNNGDGHINAYDPGTGTFLGQLADDNGNPITIPNLWALTFGNGYSGGDAETLFFAAGVNYDEHGLFGAIQSPERRGADTAGSGVFDPHAPVEPGDYPLPPIDGPAILSSSQDRTLLIADLLPLSESSLVLVPTLSNIPQSRTRIETFIPAAPIGSVPMSGSVFTGVPTSDAVMLFLADEDSLPERGTHSDAVALNTFLDLNASQSVPHKENVQRSGTTLLTFGARGSPSADRDAGTDALFSEAYIKKLETQSSEEQGPGALSSSRQAEEHDGYAVGDECVESRVSSWINLMNALFVGSIPMIWAYWLNFPRSKWRDIYLRDIRQ